MDLQQPTTRQSRWIGPTIRESKPREPAVTRVDRDIGKINNGLQKDRSRDFRLLVDQEEGERSMIRVEHKMIRLEPFSQRQSNQRCRHPIRRNPLPRGLHNRRSPLQCARRTYVVARLWRHISRIPKFRVVLEL